MSDAALQSLVFCLFGTLFFCTGNMVSQNSQQHSIPVFASTAWGMLYGTCYLGMFSLLMDHEFTIEVTLRYMGSLLWLTIVSTVLTFSCYLMLIGRIGASRAGYATVVFPAFALLLSTSFENYHWSLNGLIGLGFVLVFFRFGCLYPRHRAFGHLSRVGSSLFKIFTEATYLVFLVLD